MIEAASYLFKLLSPPKQARPLVENPWSLPVTDTRGDLTDPDGSASRMLAGLAWAPATFDAHIGFEGRHGTPRLGEPDATIRYPSPCPRGEARVDTVALDCWAARDTATGEIKPGPSMLLLDILQGGNVVANFFARSLAKKGIHAFVMHMPFNGKRRRPGQGDYDWREFLPSLHQAVTDARRARDVISALPFVSGPVGIQGTSLGGFVSSVAAAMDDAFNPVIITLAGVDVYRVLTEGKIDAAKVYRRLCNAGHDDFTLRRSLWKTEPLRVAHRLNPDKTWLLTARRDQVVPRYNTDLLARAAAIRPDRRIRFAGCHYSCVINTPWIVGTMADAIHATHTTHKAARATPTTSLSPTRYLKKGFSKLAHWATDLEPLGA